MNKRLKAHRRKTRVKCSSSVPRREFLKATGLLAGFQLLGPGAPAVSPAQGKPGEMEVGEAEGPLSPRGTRRILYVSDPSSIAITLLPDPA